MAASADHDHLVVVALSDTDAALGAIVTALAVAACLLTVILVWAGLQRPRSQRMVRADKGERTSAAVAAQASSSQPAHSQTSSSTSSASSSDADLAPASSDPNLTVESVVPPLQLSGRGAPSPAGAELRRRPWARHDSSSTLEQATSMLSSAALRPSLGSMPSTWLPSMGRKGPVTQQQQPQHDSPAGVARAATAPPACARAGSSGQQPAPNTTVVEEQRHGASTDADQLFVPTVTSSWMLQPFHAALSPAAAAAAPGSASDAAAAAPAAGQQAPGAPPSLRAVSAPLAGLSSATTQGDGMHVTGAINLSDPSTSTGTSQRTAHSTPPRTSDEEHVPLAASTKPPASAGTGGSAAAAAAHSRAPDDTARPRDQHLAAAAVRLAHAVPQRHGVDLAAVMHAARAHSSSDAGPVYGSTHKTPPCTPQQPQRQPPAAMAGVPEVQFVRYSSPVAPRRTAAAAASALPAVPASAGTGTLAAAGAGAGTGASSAAGAAAAAASTSPPGRPSALYRSPLQHVTVSVKVPTAFSTGAAADLQDRMARHVVSASGLQPRPQPQHTIMHMVCIPGCIQLLLSVAEWQAAESAGAAAQEQQPQGAGSSVAAAGATPFAATPAAAAGAATAASPQLVDVPAPDWLLGAVCRGVEEFMRAQQGEPGGVTAPGASSPQEQQQGQQAQQVPVLIHANDSVYQLQPQQASLTAPWTLAQLQLPPAPTTEHAGPAAAAAAQHPPYVAREVHLPPAPGVIEDVSPALAAAAQLRSTHAAHAHSAAAVAAAAAVRMQQAYSALPTVGQDTSVPLQVFQDASAIAPAPLAISEPLPPAASCTLADIVMESKAAEAAAAAARSASPAPAGVVADTAPEHVPVALVSRVSLRLPEGMGAWPLCLPVEPASAAPAGAGTTASDPAAAAAAAATPATPAVWDPFIEDTPAAAQETALAGAAWPAPHAGDVHPMVALHGIPQAAGGSCRVVVADAGGCAMVDQHCQVVDGAASFSVPASSTSKSCRVFCLLPSPEALPGSSGGSTGSRLGSEHSDTAAAAELLACMLPLLYLPAEAVQELSEASRAAMLYAARARMVAEQPASTVCSYSGSSTSSPITRRESGLAAAAGRSTPGLTMVASLFPSTADSVSHSILCEEALSGSRHVGSFELSAPGHNSSDDASRGGASRASRTSSQQQLLPPATGAGSRQTGSWLMHTHPGATSTTAGVEGDASTHSAPPDLAHMSSSGNSRLICRSGLEDEPHMLNLLGRLFEGATDVHELLNAQLLPLLADLGVMLDLAASAAALAAGGAGAGVSVSGRSAAAATAGLMSLGADGASSSDKDAPSGGGSASSSTSSGAGRAGVPPGSVALAAGLGEQLLGWFAATGSWHCCCLVLQLLLDVGVHVHLHGQVLTRQAAASADTVRALLLLQQQQQQPAVNDDAGDERAPAGSGGSGSGSAGVTRARGPGGSAAAPTPAPAALQRSLLQQREVHDAQQHHRRDQAQPSLRRQQGSGAVPVWPRFDPSLPPRSAYRPGGGAAEQLAAMQQQGGQQPLGIPIHGPCHAALVGGAGGGSAESDRSAAGGSKDGSGRGGSSSGRHSSATRRAMEVQVETLGRHGRRGTAAGHASSSSDEDGDEDDDSSSSSNASDVSYHRLSPTAGSPSAGPGTHLTASSSRSAAEGPAAHRGLAPGPAPVSATAAAAAAGHGRGGGGGGSGSRSILDSASEVVFCAIRRKASCSRQ